jgi:hypothetical protein
MRPLTTTIAVAALALSGIAGSTQAAAIAATPLPPYSASWADPAGDVTTVPDLTGLTVSNDASGVLTFSVAIGNRSTPTADDVIGLAIDADHDATTGDQGVEDVLALHEQSSGTVETSYEHWNGTSYDNLPLPQGFSATYTGPSATFTVPASGLGVGPSFNVAAFGSMVGTQVEDDTSFFTYDVGGPAAQPQLVVHPIGHPIARAGKILLTRVVPTFGGKTVDGRLVDVSCHAKIAGKTVEALTYTTSGRGGPVGCAIDVGKHARGKLLVVQMRIAYQNVAVKHTYTYRVH